MAFENLSSDDKLTFLKTVFDNLQKRATILEVEMESQIKKKDQFSKLFTGLISNKSMVEALKQTFEILITSKYPQEADAIQKQLTNAYKERILANIAEAIYLTPKEKETILKVLNKPFDGLEN